MSGILPLSLPGIAYMGQELDLGYYCLAGPCYRLSSLTKWKIADGSSSVCYGQ